MVDVRWNSPTRPMRKSWLDGSMIPAREKGGGEQMKKREKRGREKEKVKEKEKRKKMKTREKQQKQRRRGEEVAMNLSWFQPIRNQDIMT